MLKKDILLKKAYIQCLKQLEVEAVTQACNPPNSKLSKLSKEAVRVIGDDLGNITGVWYSRHGTKPIISELEEK